LTSTITYSWRLRQVDRVSEYEYEGKYLALGYIEGEMLEL